MKKKQNKNLLYFQIQIYYKDFLQTGDKKYLLINAIREYQFLGGKRDIDKYQI